MGTLLSILVPAALFVAVAAIVLARARRLGRDPAVPPRPWWGNPAVWIGASAAFVLLGLFVFPRLFGFVFLFLPFIWVGTMRRREERHRREGPF